MNSASGTKPKDNVKDILNKYREAGKISVEAKKLRKPMMSVRKLNHSSLKKVLNLHFP
jgi:hypothetical protein